RLLRQGGDLKQPAGAVGGDDFGAGALERAGQQRRAFVGRQGGGRRQPNTSRQGGVVEGVGQGQRLVGRGSALGRRQARRQLGQAEGAVVGVSLAARGGQGVGQQVRGQMGREVVDGAQAVPVFGDGLGGLQGRRHQARRQAGRQSEQGVGAHGRVVHHVKA